MFVTKRNGLTEPRDINKIHKVTEWACDGLEASQSELEMEANLLFFDGMKTSVIHDSLIQAAAGLISVERMDYTFVAARLVLQKVYKEAWDSVNYPTMRQYIERGIAEGKLNPRLAIDFDLETLDTFVVPQRDLYFTYMGLQTLVDRYFIREGEKGTVIELPQHFYMRVAMGLALNESDKTARVKEFYDVLSSHNFSNSTPTLFNSGTNHSQLASCFLNTVKDALVSEPGTNEYASIMGTITECAVLSKYAGGVGTDWHRVRELGSWIKGTDGTSSGPIPYLKIYNDVAVAVNQGGKRQGSFAPYLEPHHPDLYAFCDLKKESGDERQRAHDIYPALWMNDLFFKRKEEGGLWSFFSSKKYPELHELWGKAFEARYLELEAAGAYSHQLPAKDVWKKILSCLFETSHPWITFKDECNRRNPQQHVGVIHNSNLCVAPETLVLTDRGQLPIATLSGKKVNVWNGEEFSEVEVVKTGVSQQLLTVRLDNGASLDCTPYHKFYVTTDNGSVVEKRASELAIGDKLIKFDLPVIDDKGADDFPMAYTHGFFCGDGTYGKNGTPILHLYGEKKALVPHFEIHSGSGIDQAGGRQSYILPRNLAPKFAVPSNASLRSRLDWFAGLLDADGTIARNGENESIQLASIEHGFLKDVRLMLQTLGVEAKVKKMRDATITRFADNQPAYECAPLYRLLINSVDAQKLLELGLQCKRLSIVQRTPQRCAAQFVKVVTVWNHGRVDDTYCFTEHKRHMGMFNGILTGNCTEITLNTSDDETAVCNIGSVNLAKHVLPGGGIDFAKLRETVRVAMRMLDNVIDINFYGSERARASNMRHRPVGLGVMGYTEAMVACGINWESQAHLEWADALMERFSYYAIEASSGLAYERGAYESFAGSLWSQGILPIDTANKEALALTARPIEMNWEALREKVRSQGMRNSNTMAIAPTATISNIVGTTPTIEPIYERVFTAKNLSGPFKVVDPSLRYGRPELCLEAFEIDPMWLLKAAAKRQIWLDQAQSTNIFVKAGVKGKDLDRIYTTAWQLGLKTTYYLKGQSVKAAKQPAPVTAAPVEEEPVNNLCSLDNPSCDSCQ